MENEPHHTNQAAALFLDILDSLIVDVASEAHRAARLGFDYRLGMDEEEEQRLSAEARSTVGEASGEAGGGTKYVVDVFGQSHPVIATQLVDCMSCNRSIAAGRFAPHLEKCMGKGRKARSAANRNILGGQQQQQQQQQQRRPRVANNSQRASGNDSTPSDE